MKKIVLFLLCCIALCDHSHAQVVFDFSTDDAYTLFGLSGFSAYPSGSYLAYGDITSDVSTTSYDVTVTVTPNTNNGLINRMWTGSLRLYGGTMTVSASRKNITAIKFTLNSNKWGANNSADVGTLETGTRSWFGNASTVVITIAANTQIKKMEVYQEGDDTPVTIDWTSSATSPLTVAQVLQKGAQLDEGADSGKEVYVKGKISQITEIGTVNESTGEPYGNATYCISDDGSASSELVVFRGFGLNGAKLAQGDINVGNEVVVVGKIKNFKNQDGSTTLEVNQGNKLYSLNGQTEGGDTPGPGPQPQVEYTPQGDGSFANPFNIDAIRSMDAQSTSEAVQTEVWVKAVVFGYITSSTLSENTIRTAPAEGEEVTKSNLVLIDASHNDVTALPNIAYMAPVNLPTGDVRDALNLSDNSNLTGQTIWVCGDVLKYMGVPGLKNVKKYSLDGVNILPLEYYNITYIIDGVIYSSYQLLHGSFVTPETPQKEGYTFSGWDNLPATMPNHDVTVTGSFIVNQYTITYKIDGNVYETQTVDYGTTINSPNPPELTGYTFKWDNVPTSLPAKDITIEGRYIPNVYKITYWVDDVSYKVVDVAYGANIVAETDPEKDGYTFSGWSEMPATMPAHDVTVTGSFTINTYKVIYVVNGEEYKSFEVEYGANVPIAEALEREGYTFSGWSMIPTSMPAHDIVITASFTKGAYKLIYIVDGEVYKILSYDFEDGITPEGAPVKEGYTFSGWSEIPETMPANDVAVIGTFSINQYILTLMVGDNVYETLTLDYASSIVLPDMPALTGYTFSWGEAPATMPAKDLTITGEYTPISYNVTYLINGQFYAIVKLPYGTTITPPDVPERDGLTFAWIDVPETMPAHDITIEGTYTDGLMEVKAGMSASGIYNLSGQRLSKPQRGVNIINGKKVLIK